MKILSIPSRNANAGNAAALTMIAGNVYKKLEDLVTGWRRIYAVHV